MGKNTKSGNARQQTAETEPKPRSDRNVWVGSGRLTTDPEAFGEVVKFGLAVHSVHNVNGDPVESTTFLRVTVFGEEGDKCLEYLKKGREVDIVGSIETGEYELKSNGEPVFYDDDPERPVIIYPLELLTSDVQFRR